MTSQPSSKGKWTSANLHQAFPIIVAIPLFAVIFYLNIVFIKPTMNELMDFGSFIAAGKLEAAGDNLYSTKSPLVYVIGGQTLPSPNLNPPISIIMFQPFAHLDPLQAVRVWRFATVIQFGLVLLLLAKVYPMRLIWAISLAGLWNTIALGQIYAPLLILATLTWIFTEKGYFKLAGVAIGVIIALKPNFAFWLLLLGAAQYYSIFLSAVITVAVLWLLPVLTFGTRIYQQWLTALSEYPSSGLLIGGNSSLQSLSARFGSFIPGTILISPFAWPGYTILSLPIFISKTKWGRPFTISAILLTFPYLIIMYFLRESLFTSVVLGWLYGWGLLFILVELLVNFNKEDRALL